MQVEDHNNHLVPSLFWPSFLHKTAIGLASLLLASAGICWLAANWEHASALQKLAGIQILLVLLVLLAWRTMGRASPSAGRDFSPFGVLASLASVAVGGLLALVGQIYQTGADPWQLFLLWAVLLLPWLVWVRTVFIGVLFGLLLNLAAALYLDVFGGHFWFNAKLSWMAASLMLAVMNAVLLALWEWADSQFDDAWRIGPRALATALSVWLVVGTIAGLDTLDGMVWPALSGLLACALMYGIYTVWRSDLAMACLAAATAYVLLAIFLVSKVDSEGGLLLVIMVLVVLAGLGLRQLARLIRGAVRAPATQSSMEGAKDDAPGLDPWYFSLLRIAVMGLAAILVIAFLFLTLNLEYEQLWVIGLVIGGLGLLVLRGGGGSVLDELGTTLTVAGLLMTGVGLFDLDEIASFYRAGGIVLMGLIVYCLASGAALRFLCAFFVLALAYQLTWPEYLDAMPLDLLDGGSTLAYFPAYLRLWWLAVAAVLALAVARHPGKKVFWLPLAWALVCLTQAAAWVTPAPTVLGLAEVRQQAPGLMLIWVACALLPVVSLAALMWRAGNVPRWLSVAAPLALAVASLGWLGAPGVSMALLWLVLGYALGQRALLAFAVLALLTYLSRFYYQMDASLLEKSLVLGVTGAWLLLSWLALRAQAAKLWAARAGQEPAYQAPQASGRGHVLDRAGWRSPWAVAGLWAGLIIVLLVVNSGIYQREQILRHGQTLVLALAPVDPRSLMQGDYMALRFAAEQETLQWLDKAPVQLAQSVKAQRGGWLVLKADANGEHHVQAVLADYPSVEPADATKDTATTLLEFRLRDRGVRIVTDAWFFPEGQAVRYEQARYGELRVNSSGVGLLTGLLDEQQRPLP